MRNFGFGFGRKKLSNFWLYFDFGRKTYAHFWPPFGFGRNLKITFGRSLGHTVIGALSVRWWWWWWWNWHTETWTVLTKHFKLKNKLNNNYLILNSHHLSTCVCVCVGYDWTPCMSDPCHHLSTCIVEQHSPSVHTYKCACPHGFSGRNCQSGDVTHIMSSTVKRSSTVSPMNVGKVLGIPDRDRLHATWLRLSSHKLVTERGRWSRIPRQDRLCPCGVIPPVA